MTQIIVISGILLYLRGCYYKYVMLVEAAIIQQNSVSLENNDIKRNATEIVLKHWYEVLW